MCTYIRYRMNNPGKDSHKIISPLELKKTVNLALVLALVRVRKSYLFFACLVRSHSLAQSAGWPSSLPPPKKRCHFLICPREILTWRLFVIAERRNFLRIMHSSHQTTSKKFKKKRGLVNHDTMEMKHDEDRSRGAFLK